MFREFASRTVRRRPRPNSFRWSGRPTAARPLRSEEHTSELQSLRHLVCRLLLDKKNSEGETIFEAAVRVAFDVELSSPGSVGLDAFANQRLASHYAIKRTRPIIELKRRVRLSSL